MREIKFQFIIDGKHVTRSYTIEEMLDRGITHEHILEDAEGPCTCSLNESTAHCEGDCAQFDKSEVTGKRQFTGLRDKNGKEIYEGDVLKCESYSVEIKYQGGQFIGYNENNLIEETQNRNWLQWEKIGNIHDNPELLK